MIADLHAHYAMHLLPDTNGDPLGLLVTPEGRARLRDRIRAQLVGLASRFANYRSFDSGPRVTVPYMREGQVGVAFSVLYSFFDELDLDSPYGAPPEDGYLPRLLAQLEMVEQDIRERHAGEATVVHDLAELEAALAADRLALVHCIEGGFHLGASEETVRHAVGQLAGRGVAYITLAHLLWRGVATNAPALPFLSDRIYRLVFPQPKRGLTELGRTALEAMVENRVLVDLSHMSEAALADSFELLDRLDPAKRMPVISSHSAYRFGGQEYGVSDRVLLQIAARDGVVGLIFAQHQLNDGLRRKRTRSLEESLEVLCRHIDRLHEVTGTHAHTAIGSDLDGFIKPTIGGVETMADMRALEGALRERYGREVSDALCSGNALRVLRRLWGAP